MPEALAIGVDFVLEREAVDPADVYVSTGVMRESPDEPFRYTAYLAEAYEPRETRPEERVPYRELGLASCDTRAQEDLPCPGLGTSNRRTKLIAGGRPVRDEADDAGWLVPVTIISLDQEEPSYWLTAWLLTRRGRVQWSEGLDVRRAGPQTEAAYEAPRRLREPLLPPTPEPSSTGAPFPSRMRAGKDGLPPRHERVSGQRPGV